MSDILSDNPDVLVWFHRLVTLKTATEITKAISNRDKQIRQQIGRELIERELVMTEHGINNAYDIPYVTSYDICKVCQLEEE